jgi:dTDP-4-amino-4,6-dideoxygalactose transaminase
MDENLPITFNRPSLVGTEFDYVRQAAEFGKFSGDGLFTHRCRELLERELGDTRVLLTPSCTHALELAALLLDLAPGDEVVVPSFTFVSTANAFVLRGARPVFADIRPDTMNLDESRLEALITPRTRAIVPVHYAGVGCEMDAILAIARARGIAVVEDNAHGLFGRYKGRSLGTLGEFGAQSFHETKNFNCGEGGALLVNDARYLERAEILREKGTNRSRFFRGEIDHYSWVDLGSSYLLSDVLAAFLYAQLEAREAIQAARRAIWERYHERLAGLEQSSGVQLPTLPAECEPSYHMFYLVLPTQAQRDELIAWLRERGILAVFHYLPLHLSKMGRRFGGTPGACPVTERISPRLVRLPFYKDLTPVDQEHVIDSVCAFFRR